MGISFFTLTAAIAVGFYLANILTAATQFGIQYWAYSRLAKRQHAALDKLMEQFGDLSNRIPPMNLGGEGGTRH